MDNSTPTASSCKARSSLLEDLEASLGAFAAGSTDVHKKNSTVDLSVSGDSIQDLPRELVITTGSCSHGSQATVSTATCSDGPQATDKMAATQSTSEKGSGMSDEDEKSDSPDEGMSEISESSCELSPHEQWTDHVIDGDVALILNRYSSLNQIVKSDLQVISEEDSDFSQTDSEYEISSDEEMGDDDVGMQMLPILTLTQTSTDQAVLLDVGEDGEIIGCSSESMAGCSGTQEKDRQTSSGSSVSSQDSDVLLQEIIKLSHSLERNQDLPSSVDSSSSESLNKHEIVSSPTNDRSDNLFHFCIESSNQIACGQTCTQLPSTQSDVAVLTSPHLQLSAEPNLNSSAGTSSAAEQSSLLGAMTSTAYTSASLPKEKQFTDSQESEMGQKTWPIKSLALSIFRKLRKAKELTSDTEKGLPLMSHNSGELSHSRVDMVESVDDLNSGAQPELLSSKSSLSDLVNAEDFLTSPEGSPSPSRRGLHHPGQLDAADGLQSNVGEVSGVEEEVIASAQMSSDANSKVKAKPEFHRSLSSELLARARSFYMDSEAMTSSLRTFVEDEHSSEESDLGCVSELTLTSEDETGGDTISTLAEGVWVDIVESNITDELVSSASTASMTSLSLPPHEHLSGRNDQLMQAGEADWIQDGRYGDGSTVSEDEVFLIFSSENSSPSSTLQRGSGTLSHTDLRCHDDADDSHVNLRYDEQSLSGHCPAEVMASSNEISAIQKKAFSQVTEEVIVPTSRPKVEPKMAQKVEEISSGNLLTTATKNRNTASNESSEKKKIALDVEEAKSGDYDSFGRNKETVDSDPAPRLAGDTLIEDTQAPTKRDDEPLAEPVRISAETASDFPFAENDLLPTVNDSSPAVSDSSPAVVDSAPAVGDSSPAAIDSAPAVSDSSPAAIDSSPAISDSSPAENIDSDVDDHEPPPDNVTLPATLPTSLNESDRPPVEAPATLTLSESVALRRHSGEHLAVDVSPLVLRRETEEPVYDVLQSNGKPAGRTFSLSPVSSPDPLSEKVSEDAWNQSTNSTTTSNSDISGRFAESEDQSTSYKEESSADTLPLRFSSEFSPPQSQQPPHIHELVARKEAPRCGWISRITQLLAAQDGDGGQALRSDSRIKIAKWNITRALRRQGHSLNDCEEDKVAEEVIVALREFIEGTDKAEESSHSVEQVMAQVELQVLEDLSQKLSNSQTLADVNSRNSAPAHAQPYPCSCSSCAGSSFTSSANSSLGSTIQKANNEQAEPTNSQVMNNSNLAHQLLDHQGAVHTQQTSLSCVTQTDSKDQLTPGSIVLVTGLCQPPSNGVDGYTNHLTSSFTDSHNKKHLSGNVTDSYNSKHLPTNGVTCQPPANGVTRQPPANGVTRQPPANGVTRQPPANGVTRQPPANGVTRQPPANGVNGYTNHLIGNVPDSHNKHLSGNVTDSYTRSLSSNSVICQPARPTATIDTSRSPVSSDNISQAPPHNTNTKSFAKDSAPHLRWSKASTTVNHGDISLPSSTEILIVKETLCSEILPAMAAHPPRLKIRRDTSKGASKPVYSRSKSESEAVRLQKSSGPTSAGYSDSYAQQSSSLQHRPRSEHGFSTNRKQSRASHYSSSPEYHRPMSDYGGTRKESRYSTMRSDATGDWQYFGPNEVPMQRSTLRRQEDVSPGRPRSDYHGPSSNGTRQVFRSSQSDYNVPTSRRSRPSVGGPLSDYGGSTHSLKIVRKTSTPKNGYLSSSDESYQDGRYFRSNSVPRNSKQNSLMKKTVRRTIRRRDSSPTPGEPQRIVVQEPKEPERISVFINDEVDRAPQTKDRTRSLGRDASRSHSLGRDRTPGKVHTIQTLTREKSLSGMEHPVSSNHTMERTHSSQTMSQPLQVSTTMRKEVVTNQQSQPPPITSGHTTLTFSGPVKPIREETYVNKVFQENDQPTPKKPAESFKSGVIQTDDRVVHEPIIPHQAPIYYEPPKPASHDLHKTRITFVRSELPAVQHSSKIDVEPIQQFPAPHSISAPQPAHEVPAVQYYGIRSQERQLPKPSKRSKPKREPVVPAVVIPNTHDAPTPSKTSVEEVKEISSDSESSLSEDTTPESQPVVESPVKKPAIVSAPRGRDEPDTRGKGRQLPDEYFEEVLVRRSADIMNPRDRQEETTKKSTKISKLVKYMEPPPQRPEANQEVEEITEDTIEEFYAGMTPERQKTFSELTKTALGRTEQTTGNFFNGDGKSLITEAWHTNRPKTEREVIDEITSKTTSEVVKKSILDGIDYKFVPTHSKELEEIQRKRKEFEAEMERQRKIRDIKAGIRQRIHVDHNEEDLVGDYSMSITEDGQIDMDTIEEHVDLGINENGIAAIAVKVTAERILPVDVDNNLWRKNSVTVTRTIEIDLMRCEETRQLYEKILQAHKSALNARAEAAAKQGLPPQQKVTHELDATDTYKIFSALMNVTGEGDNEDLGILNLQTNDVSAERSGTAAKHFLSGDYIKDPEEKAKAFGKSGGRSSSRQGETTTRTTTTTSSTNSGKANMFEDLTLNSINPEKIRSERTSEYYKQRMRDSPPPDFTSSMFDGRKFSNKFDEDKARSTQSFEHTSEQRSRSPSPVRGMTSNQRKFYEQSRKEMKTPSRSRLYDPRRDVTGGGLDLSPPRYTERTERREYRSNRSTSPTSRSTSLGRENGSSKFDQKQEGEGVLFSERVHGVKQRANEMRRNSELGGSRDSLSHSPEGIRYEETITVEEEEEPNYNNNAIDAQTRVGRRRLASRDDLLFGGEGDYERAVSEESEKRYQSKARDSLESHRSKMLGHQHPNRTHSKDNYESGYYSDMPPARHEPPNSDINRMLHDAERYFKKTASEREISRSPEGYYSPRYNKEHSTHRDSEPADYETGHDSVVESSQHSLRREMNSPRSEGRGHGHEYSERRVQYEDGRHSRERRDDSIGRSHDRNRARSEDGRYSYGGSSSVTKSERHVEHDDSYMQAPAEQIFDTEDSYFHQRHNEGSNCEYKAHPSQHARVFVGDYFNVKARRAKLRQEMSEKGIDSEQAIADRRQAMLGGRRYAPNTVRSQRVVTSSRRSTGGRR